MLDKGKSLIIVEMGKNDDKDVLVKNEKKVKMGHIANNGEM